MAPISVSVEREDPPVGVVTLIGEHDAYSAERLEDELAVLRESGLRVVVDLTEATFVDSQTLSALLTARHHAEAASTGFVLVLPDGNYTQVHRLLEMTGLDRAFAVAPTLPKAIAAARAGHADGSQLKVA